MPQRLFLNICCFGYLFKETGKIKFTFSGPSIVEFFVVYGAMSFRLQTTCLKTVHLWLGWSKLECSRAGTVMEHWQGTYVLKQCLILVLDSRYFFRTFNCWVFCCSWCHVILSSDNSSKDILHMDCVEWGAQDVSSNAVELDGPLTRDLCFKTVPNTFVVFSWQLFILGLKCGGKIIMILGIVLSGASVIKQYHCNLLPFHNNYWVNLLDSTERRCLCNGCTLLW